MEHSVNEMYGVRVDIVAVLLLIFKELSTITDGGEMFRDGKNVHTTLEHTEKFHCPPSNA